MARDRRVRNLCDCLFSRRECITTVRTASFAQLRDSICSHNWNRTRCAPASTAGRASFTGTLHCRSTTPLMKTYGKYCHCTGGVAAMKPSGLYYVRARRCATPGSCAAVVERDFAVGFQRAAGFAAEAEIAALERELARLARGAGGGAEGRSRSAARAYRAREPGGAQKNRAVGRPLPRISKTRPMTKSACWRCSRMLRPVSCE